MRHGIFLASAIVLSACGLVLPDRAFPMPAQVVERCTPTPITEHAASPSFAGGVRLVVSGGFAAWPRLPDVGTYWYLRDAPRPSITLRAESLGASRRVVEFEAIGYPLGAGFAPDWDTGWYYRTAVTAVDRLPLPSGCWRVTVVGRPPNDALVYRVGPFARPTVPRQ